jgi:DNA invertase Pin-like site-specific DNA recombinase
MKNVTLSTAVSYCRVSTLEQGNKRLSLENQLKILQQFCEGREIAMLKSFKDTTTGTKFDREGFNALKEYCKKQKPNYVLVWRWDRLGRNAVEMLATVKEFQRMGIEINAVEQWKEDNSADNMFMLGLQAILAERESAITGERVKMNILKTQEQGIWLNKSPIGYRRSNVLDEKGKRAIEVCPVGSVIVKEVYELFLDGMDRMKIHLHIRSKFRSELKEIKQSFVPMAIRRILTNVFYTGRIQFGDTEGVRKTVEAKHPAIISRSDFDKAQNKLDELDSTNEKSERIEREDYPLKGNILCQTCGVPLRAYSVKKNLKKGAVQTIHYYDCKKSHFRIQAKEAHDIVEEAFAELTLTDSEIEKSKIIIKERIETFLQNQLKVVQESTKQIEEFQGKAKRLDELLMDGLNIQDYNRMKKEVQKNIDELELKLATVADFIKVQNQVKNTALGMLLDLKGNYKKSNGFLKKKIIKAVFPHGLFIEKNTRTVLTQFINTFITLTRSESMSYKKIELLTSEQLPFCSPKGRQIEPKTVNLSNEMALINSLAI